MNKIKEITHSGELDLAGFKLPCHVLEDGRRVLSLMGVQLTLKMVDEDDKQKSGSRLGRYLNKKSFEPLISVDKNHGRFQPIICYRGGQKINCFEATILVDIANVFLEGRKRGILSTDREKLIAEQCEIIIRSFAKVGIIALIDEATGYQYEREKDELQKQLQKILGIYVLKKPEKWQKIFPWTFYKQIFRLWGQPFTVEIIVKPGFIGRLTNKYVYQNLPEGVLERLKERTPKTQRGNYKHKLHQLLTTEIGREDLKKTINSIEVLASVSETKKEFEILEAKYRRQKELLYNDFVKDEARDKLKARIKKDFDRKFEALLNTPSPKKDE